MLLTAEPRTVCRKVFHAQANIVKRYIFQINTQDLNPSLLGEGTDEAIHFPHHTNNLYLAT